MSNSSKTEAVGGTAEGGATNTLALAKTKRAGG